MAQTHVISALVAKHSELEGLILAKQAEICSIQEILRHVDRTIKVFSPEFDLRTIRATRTNTRNAFFAHGEAQRIVLEVMRAHSAAMTSRQMADMIIERKEIEIETNTVSLIQKNVLNVLRRLERKGVVMLVDRNDSLLHWQIV